VRSKAIASGRPYRRLHHLRAISLGLVIALCIGWSNAAPPGKVIANKALDLEIPTAYVDSTTLRSPDQDYEVLHAVLPDMRPSSPSGWNDPLHVRIEISRLNGPSRTQRFLAEYERLKDSTALGRPILVSAGSGERKFIKRTGRSTSNVATYVVRHAEGESPWTIEDPGPWSRKLSVDRTVDGLAVRYQFRKEGTPGVDAVDSAVISLVRRLAVAKQSRQ
jgi:hypothetical protein